MLFSWGDPCAADLLRERIAEIFLDLSSRRAVTARTYASAEPHDHRVRV